MYTNGLPKYKINKQGTSFLTELYQYDTGLNQNL